MRLDDLINQTGYVLFLFNDERGFYVHTSFNVELCPKPEEGCIYDMLSEKNIPVRIFKDAKYQVTNDEPVSWKEESDFIKQFI